MPAFAYQALSADGSVKAGAIEAADRGDALRQLARRGAVVLRFDHFGCGDSLGADTDVGAGRWQEDDALGIESVGSVRIRMKRPSVKVMIDGEVEMFTSPLDFRIRPKALTVLAPVAAVVTDPADGELIAVTG